MFLGDAHPLEARDGRRGPGGFALRLLSPLAFEDALALRSERSHVDLGRERRLLLGLELCRLLLGDALLRFEFEERLLFGLELCRFLLGDALPLKAG